MNESNQFIHRIFLTKGYLTRFVYLLNHLFRQKISNLWDLNCFFCCFFAFRISTTHGNRFLKCFSIIIFEDYFEITFILYLIWLSQIETIHIFIQRIFGFLKLYLSIIILSWCFHCILTIICFLIKLLRRTVYLGICFRVDRNLIKDLSWYLDISRRCWTI